MTKSILALMLSASAVVLLASACSDDSSDYEYDRGWRGGYGDGCHQYTSCGTCTPVLGCGWCTTGVGLGMCAADPNECDGAQSFSWTWDPSGCFPPPVDAGVVAPVDAAPASPTDAAVATPIDSASPAPETDADSAGGSAAH
jgi:hypothetical protein